MKPLSVGDVVSASLRIYRDNFKKYFKLALIGYLWVFVPVYGWAKCSAMMGVIARLAFKEVSEEPESVRDAQRYVDPRKWVFFATGLLVGLIISGAIVPYFFLLGIILAVVGFISAAIPSEAVRIILIVSLIVAGTVGFIFGIIWLISKLFLVELPLALEENANVASTISRSWQLTQGSVRRIWLVVILTILISLPLGILTNVLSIFFQMVLSTLGESAPGLVAIGGLFYIAFLFASSALILPIWQSVKAVIYYDLRMRHEGMGISLRK